MGEMGITRSDYLISITVIVVTTAGLFGFLTAGLFPQQSCGFLSPSNTAMVLLISPDFLSVQKAWLLSSMGNLYDNHKALIRN